MVRELKATYNYSVSQTIDEDDMGFVVSRSALYVSNVKTFFLYFDELMHWCSTYLNEKENLYKLVLILKKIMHVEWRIDIIFKNKCTQVYFRNNNFDTVQNMILQVRIGGNTKPYPQQLASIKIHGVITKQSSNDFNADISPLSKRKHIISV